MKVERINILKLHLMSVPAEDDEELAADVGRVPVPRAGARAFQLLGVVARLVEADDAGVELASASRTVIVNILAHLTNRVDHTLLNRRP